MKILECIATTTSFEDIAQFRSMIKSKRHGIVYGTSVYVSHSKLTIKDDKPIKNYQLYKVIAYKICKRSEGGNILCGHEDGAHDSIVRSLMEKFVKHQRYYLKQIHLEEVENG
jgi:hypothetical protein